MARTTQARQDAIDAAVRLFRSQGYSATGLSQLLDESGAPKGSFYFHFPGGKEQLAREALAAFGEQVRSRIARRAAAIVPGEEAAFVRALFDVTGQELVASDYTAGCVAANLGSEMASGNRAIAEDAARVVDGWIEAIADGVATRFGDRDGARAYAGTLIATLSGLRTQARSRRSIDGFAAAADVLIRALPSPDGRESGTGSPVSERP